MPLKKLEEDPEDPIAQKLAELRAEMAKKDEELRKKDGALAGKVEELKIKDEQIQELRRRLPRSLN